jgi:hypothetical protein
MNDLRRRLVLLVVLIVLLSMPCLILGFLITRPENRSGVLISNHYGETMSNVQVRFAVPDGLRDVGDVAYGHEAFVSLPKNAENDCSWIVYYTVEGKRWSVSGVIDAYTANWVSCCVVTKEGLVLLEAIGWSEHDLNRFIPRIEQPREYKREAGPG